MLIRYLNTVKKTGAQKYKSSLVSNFHGCQEKNPPQKIIDLPYRPNLLPSVLSEGISKRHNLSKVFHFIIAYFPKQEKAVNKNYISFAYR